MESIGYRARWVFPVEGPPLEDACVMVRGERIVAVGRKEPADEVVDLGNAAVLPGLINAHTHLEFSDLAAPLGEAGMAFPQWIRRVIAHRRQVQHASDAVERGVQESERSGVTAVGEIAQPSWRAECFHGARLETTVFLELLGLADEVVEQKLHEARRHLRQQHHEGSIRRGLSPHAPYTVSWRLLEGAVALAREHSAPVAMHLAESREELRLLKSADGPFRVLFDELGFWVERAIPRGVRPLDYLQCLIAAPRALVIHGNYLDDEEIGFLSQHAERMSVVYCPRTHARFGHEEHPWRRMLQRGVNVALGTDSRATNPDLSLLGELRWLAGRAGADPAAMVKMATLAGAKALGIEQQAGSLRPGKLANLTVVPLAGGDSRDPHELLLASDAEPSAVVWRGQLCPLGPATLGGL